MEKQINLTITINTPDLSAAILALAETIALGFDKVKGLEMIEQHIAEEAAVPWNPEPAAVIIPDAPEPEPVEAETPAPDETVTIEQVRAKLATFSKSGRQSDLKTLFASFGVAKLSQVPKDKYAALLVAAEAIA